MIWCAEIDNQIKPAKGKSGRMPFCVPTLVGFFIGDNTMRLLRCSACGLMKLENEFSRDNHKSKKSGNNCRQALYGRTYDCLSCIRLYRKELHKRNPSIAIKQNTKRREQRKTPEGLRRDRDSVYRYRYGIALDKYEEMLKKQNGKCAICRKTETHKNQYGVWSLTVDHNHETNKVRELLCFKCNTLLGFCEESISILRKVISYLNKHLDIGVK